MVWRVSPGRKEASGRGSRKSVFHTVYRLFCVFFTSISLELDPWNNYFHSLGGRNRIGELVQDCLTCEQSCDSDPSCELQSYISAQAL